MIKQEIVEKISKYFKLTTYDAEKIYDDIFLEIINGVKEDNIADITNLGEFIIKYNKEDSPNKKTVEFLPTLSLEDEINQRAFEEQRSFEPAPFVSYGPAEKTESVVPPSVSKKEPETADEFKEASKTASSLNTHSQNTEITEDKHLVEDEIKRKREEILHKITAPAEEKLHKTEEKTIPLVVPAVNINKITNEEPVTEIFDAKKEVEKTIDNTADEVKHELKDVEEIPEKSFSDFFSEVADEKKNVSDFAGKTSVPPVENVIPPTAVELHNQITGDNSKNADFPGSLNTLPYANGNGNGNANGKNGNGDNFEHRLQDNSYYIWYKDSEPNTTDTQTMSYEYELLYQATKEAEYKSKLRIYVTTFIMFFSIVLILLIFSPVIYKYFFSPEEDQNTEEVQEETSSNSNETGTTSTENQASLNKLPENNTPPVTNTQPNNTEQGNTQQPPITQEQPKQQEPVTQQKTEPTKEQPNQEAPVQQNPQGTQPPQTNTSTPPGVTKSTMGWLDDRNKVIYIQLENGKFTIQESAWDSDAKANKRLNTVASIVPGLAGNVVKVDLGSKGTWYRARFGEFASLEEAKAKAEELRNKEKTRLHALLLTFFMYT